ncbi:MurR/RpiR family transcriptional regulator [Hydrogenoanaerobacterium sp.]|uniref:MurR/RpiR family transcriptional regulator n=1 Tax=Hydrogenoanaerobacterium sp. TaxID=2953763 RepID=UPI0028A22D70|nr:MurR/RpiR family transcriptional regulator [Hydrogenoanaerobacterium sp.]
MGEDIFEILNKKYNSLTKSEKKIANYLFSNKVEVIQLSITALSEQCGVAEATIFRFCKTLGFGGYNEFKLALAKFIFKEENSSTASVNASGSVTNYGKVDSQDTFEQMCEKLYSTQVSALEQTLKLLDETSITKAVQILSHSKRVYCFGQGASLIMAMEAWGRFITASPNFFYVEDSHMQTMASSLLTEDDAILFFSYSGATREIVDVMRLANRNGFKVILVTKFEKSPAAAFADVILLCGSNEGPLQVGSVAAKVAQLLIIDVLFNEFCRTNHEMCYRNIEITADATAKKLL